MTPMSQSMAAKCVKLAVAFLLLMAIVPHLQAETVRPGGEYYQSNDDLTVKVLGGQLRVARTWSENRWHINRRWNALQVKLDPITSTPKQIVRNTDIYSKADTAGLVFSFEQKETIRVTAIGYRWQDRQGNFIDYNSNGVVERYGDRNDIVVTLLRDIEGRITGVADHHGVQVLWYEYNASGLLTGVRDGEDATSPDTRQVVYEYAGGRLASVIDVRNNRWSYTYQGAYLGSETDPENRVRTLHYDANGRAILIEDPLGSIAEYTHDYDDARDEFYFRKKDSEGAITESWYNRDYSLKHRTINGTVIRDIVRDGDDRIETDRAGYETRYDYDQWDSLVGITHPDGATESYEYHSRFAFRTEEINENGVVTQHTYDSNGNLLETTEAVGTTLQRTIQYTYDVYGQLLTMRRVGDAMTVTAITYYDYDDKGNLVQMIDPESYETRFTHDIMGSVLTRRDTRNNLWLQSYDAAGNLVSMTSPMGAASGYSQRYEYDKVSNRTAMVAVNGQRTSFVFDARDRMIGSTAIAGKPATFSHDGEGRVLTMTDEEGHVTRYRHDAEGRQIAQTDGNGFTINFVYTENGEPGSNRLNQPATIVYPTYSQTFKYDRRGRVIETADVLPDGTRHVQIQSYDDAGNRLTLTDADRRSTTFEYDELNRLSAEIDALDVRTAMSYDNRDNLLTITTGPNNGLTRFAYDRNDRQVSETQPIGEQAISVYDGEGNLNRHIARDGQRTDFSYDADNRFILEQYARADNPDVTVRTSQYSYTVLDQLSGYNDGNTSAVYTHDSLGRKLSERTSYGAFEVETSYSYYANSQLKSVTDPSGVMTTHAYDAAGHWAGTELPGTGVITVNARSWTAPAKITYPGGTVRTMSYTPKQYLDTLAVQSPTGELRLDYDYNYTSTGNIAGIATEYGEKRYAYDAVNRLTSAINPTLDNEAYTYDKRGNRLSDASEPGTWTYTENNELENAGSTSFSYDTNGSRITKTDNQGTTQYAYNEAGRLSGVSTGDGNPISSYQYDPFGRRLWKEVDNVRTHFIYNDQGLIGEADSTGTILRIYGYQPDRTWMTDPLFLRTNTGQTLYYQNDHLGTPQQVLTVAGTTAWAQHSTAFGKRTVTVEAVENRLGFPGQYSDAETRLEYNYFRDYDLSLGRYVQSDPIGIQGGVDIYGYAYQNPLTYTDPTGETPWGLLFSGANLGLQLYQNGGDMSCVNWTDVGLSLVGGGLLNALAKGAFKFKTLGSKTWSAARHWMRKNNIHSIQSGQHRHHWLFERNQGVGRYVPDHIKNQPWNINPIPAKFNNWLGRKPWRAPLGGPSWAGEILGGAGLAGGSAAAGRNGGVCGCE